MEQTQDDVLEPGTRIPLTASDYEWATREIVKVAGICCTGRVVCLVAEQRDAAMVGGGDKVGGTESEQVQMCLAHVRALAGC